MSAKALKKRLAREAAIMAARREAARRKAVYGRRNEPAPPDEPSQSVEAIPTAFERSRRRH